ncbi:MAG: GGDEF domain-containing protein [Deltaproteobacteria bacterium]|nr:GGDEF domain-containing protein [Deltaproteobacteria bacterium]
MDDATREKVAAAIQTLPSPPALMQRIIKVAREPGVSLRRLGDIVVTEPAFTVELLRLANSPAYSLSQPVRTVQQATVTLGVRAIRNHAVAHVVRVLTAKIDLGAFNTEVFWENSLRRALLAAELARIAGFEDPQEAFTLGLVQDVGYLAMAAVWPDRTEELQAIQMLGAKRRLEREFEVCSTTHTEMFGVLTEHWDLPIDLAEAVGAHHQARPSIQDRRVRRVSLLAGAADLVSDVFHSGGSEESVREARGILAQIPTRSDLTLESLCNATQDKLPEVAKELRIRVGHQPRFEQLISEANRSLIEITHEYEDLTQALQKALEEKAALARMLERANLELQRLAATDELTGMANRRRFLHVTDTIFQDARQSGEPVSLVMFDVDHFKQVNDTYGHGAGDDVLREIARRVAGQLRTGDLVGRVGGEEFALVLPNAAPRDAWAVAQRCRQAIGKDPIKCRDEREIRVTASFGGASLEKGMRDATVDSVMKAADDAMYLSKSSGRNRVSWSKVS